MLVLLEWAQGRTAILERVMEMQVTLATLVITTVGLFLPRARWHFFAEVETMVGEEMVGEVEVERPHHQALGRGVDMTMAAIALKYLVLTTTIDLALLRVIQRSIMGEVKVEVKETVEVELPPTAGEGVVAMLV